MDAPPEVVAGEDSSAKSNYLEETVVEAVQWNAPYPPPALLQQYDEIKPGFSGELIAQVQAEAEHARAQDRKALDAAIQHGKRGQWMGFVIVLALLGVSYYTVEKGAFGVAALAMSIVVGTAAIFVLGKFGKKAEPEAEQE